MANIEEYYTRRLLIELRIFECGAQITKDHQSLRAANVGRSYRHINRYLTLQA